MAKIITTTINIEDEAKLIKSLEAKIAELQLWKTINLQNCKPVFLQSDLQMLSETISILLHLRKNTWNFITHLSNNQLIKSFQSCRVYTLHLEFNRIHIVLNLNK